MKIIDISHILNNNTPIYPEDYKINIEEYKNLEKDNYNLNLLKTTLHTGTHIDMPIHLIENDRLTSDFSIDNFIGKGIVLDVKGENPINMKDEYYDMDFENKIVLLNTGFSKFYYDEKYFFEYPIISDEFGNFLISKKIKVLGMDTPAPDFFPFILHKDLLKNNIFLL